MFGPCFLSLCMFSALNSPTGSRALIMFAFIALCNPNVKSLNFFKI